MIENVSNELKKYFEGKPILSSLLGLDMILLLGCVAIDLLDIFINFGLISSLLFYAIILSILLCLANKNFFALTIGLGGITVIHIINFLISVFSWRLFSWGSLFGIAIYGFFAYSAYKKTYAK